MPYGSIDPSPLEGDDLIGWYRRTPWEVEQEREAARLQQYNDFFGVDPGGDNDGQTVDGAASSDTSDAANDRDQTAPSAGFPAPSFGPAGYVPGLLGDTRQMVSQSSPQHGGVLSIDASPSTDDTGQGSAQTQTPATDAPDDQAAATDGPVLDGGLWPTQGDPALTPVSARSWRIPRAPSVTQNQAPTAPPPNDPRLPLPPQLRPSNGFISWLFGGPVPLKDSTGRVVGYYDHQAANAGLKITGAYAAVAPLFIPGSEAADLLAELAPGGAEAIGDGIEEAASNKIGQAAANHHAWPKYLGGPKEQELVALRKSLHDAFHTQLRVTMRKAGFPPMGGVTGTAPKWAQYFAQNPGSREKAIEMLRQVTSDFDRANGTSISPRLEQVLRDAGANPPN
jgi:hypothetical protein